MEQAASRLGRPRAHRRDATAVRLLDAVAALIDERILRTPPRTLPDVLGWINLATVHRRAGVKPNKIAARWGSTDAFLVDAALWAMRSADKLPEHEKPTDVTGVTLWGSQFGPQVVAQASEPFSPVDTVIQVSDALLASVLGDPRSFLAAHLGPLIVSSADVQNGVAASARTDQAFWRAAYQALLESTGAPLRPGWTLDRLTLALQALLDGFVLRSRLQSEDYANVKTRSVEAISLLADSVLAIILSVVDFECTNESVSSSLRMRWPASESAPADERRGSG